MTRYRIRLSEQSILEGSGDFTVDADTPELAAAILLKAHEAARDACSNLVVLADGQSRHIEHETGDEIGGEIRPDDGPPPMDTESQDSTGRSNTELQPC